MATKQTSTEYQKGTKKKTRQGSSPRTKSVTGKKKYRGQGR